MLSAQAAFLGPCGSIGDQEKRSDDAGTDGVHDKSCHTLYKDQVDRFSVDEDVQHRSHHNPCDQVAENLDQVEGKNILALEFTFLNFCSFEGKTENKPCHVAGDDPAPPW